MSRDNRLMALALFLWGAGEGLSYYFRTLYLKQLGADPVGIGSILALAAIAGGVTHIPAGYLADRFGRKQLLVVGWVCGVIAAVGMFLATTLPLFVASLLVYMFTGFVVAPINAYVTEARGKQSVQRAITMVSAGFWSGNVISPFFGGLIARQFGLRMVFGVAVIAFGLSTIAIWSLREQPLTHPAQGTTRYGPLFANRRFLAFLALMFVAMSALQLGLPFAPNFIVEVRHYDLEVVGLLGTATALGAVALNLGLGQRIPRRGFLIAQGLMLGYLALLLWAANLGWLGVAFFFQAGWNLSRSMAVSQVGRVVQSTEMGLAFGMIETVASATLTLAPFVAGLLYKLDPARPFQVSFALIALTMPLVWWLAPRKDGETVEAGAAVAEVATVREP